jgi:hypothetical protein
MHQSPDAFAPEERHKTMGGLFRLRRAAVNLLGHIGMRRNGELLLIALILIAGWTSAIPAEFQIRDSEKRIERLANMFWVDERRILFEGLNGKDAVRPDGSRVLLNSLYLWDVETGAIEDHGEIGGGLCYAHGYVRYRRWREQEVGRTLGDLIAGQLGGQLKAEPGLMGVRIDLETCQPHAEASPLPEWTAGKLVKRLKSEHGFLVLGPEKEDRNEVVTYHPKGIPDGVVMPFKRREARLVAVSYVPFKGAYFIEGDYFVVVPQHPSRGYNKSPWPKGVPIPVWWLYPDGRVEEIRLPTDSRAASWIFPATGGVYFVSHRYPDYDGLFKVLDESKVTRIVKGSVQKYVVSADGCRIAVNHDGNYIGTRVRGTVKAINVCTPGE